MSHLKRASSTFFRRRVAWFGAVCSLAIGAQAATTTVNQVWTQRSPSPNGNRERLQGMVLDGIGNVIVTGYSRNTNDDRTEIYTAKYAAASGAVLWGQRHINLVGNASPGAVAVDRSGNVIVTGTSGNGTNNDLYTAKYAAGDGALLWERHYNGPLNRNDYGTAVVLDTNDNVVVVGSADSSSNEDGDLTSSGLFIAKYAATNGALMWELPPQGGLLSPRAAAMDAVGNVVVTATLGGELSDIYTVKYAGTNGTMLWEHRHYFAHRAAPAALALDAAGNVVITGHSNGSVATQDDYYTAKYAAADGTLLWERIYNGPVNWEDDAQAVAVDQSGNVFVTGASRSPNTDYYTAKYAAADGAVLWEKRYSSGSAAAVVVDGNGNAIVSGRSPGSNYDLLTIKYAAADGAVLWKKRYDGGHNEFDIMYEGRPLALSPSGLVVVGGTSSGGDNELPDAYVTVVYRETLPPLSLARGTNGVCQVNFAGASGSTYRLQRATGLNGPWETVASSPTAPPSGVIQYHDTNSSAGQVFYRVAQP